MKIEKISGKLERRIVMAIIVDDTVCARIASRWEDNLFRSRWANIVAELCVSFFREYKKAPGQQIESLFDEWALTAKDEETAQLVSKFLTSLSGEYENLPKEINGPYIVDLASKHFKKQRLARIVLQAQRALDSNQTEKAHRLIATYKSVDIGESTHVDVLNDKEALKRAFRERSEPLFVLPGGLGKMINQILVREGFISFLAPEKMGKTTWLVWMSWQAMLQRKKVAFFSVGDESEEEMMLRFSVLASRIPRYKKVLRLPRRMVLKGKVPKVRYGKRTYEKQLTAKQAHLAFKEVLEKKLRSKNEYLRLSVHPNSSFSMRALEAQLKIWESDGFIPDVVVVDYMDIAQEEDGPDARSKINNTWKQARALAQRRHVLFMTATQASAASYGKKLITRKMFGEDKRKLAHVTGLLGINQTRTEKELGLMRVNVVLARGIEYFETRCCHCAGSMALQNPAMLTVY